VRAQFRRLISATHADSPSKAASTLLRVASDVVDMQWRHLVNDPATLATAEAAAIILAIYKVVVETVPFCSVEVAAFEDVEVEKGRKRRRRRIVGARAAHGVTNESSKFRVARRRND